MSVSGVLTVARLELMQRFRGARWYIAFLLWFTCIAGIAGLTWLAMRDSDMVRGPTTFDVVLFFVLGLSLLVMPALTATSVNGDRDAGVLATLQTTLLTPTDIIIGKLLASLVMATTFLALAAPFLVLALFQGGVGLLGVARVLVVLGVILLTVCAIGLMFSTLVARPVGSAVLTYLTVAGLSFLTLILFAMTTPLVARDEQVRVHGVEDYTTSQACTTYTDTRRVVRTDRNWWLLGVNPFVIVADAAPHGPDGPADTTSAGFTPLRWIAYGTRLAKAGPPEVHDECWSDDEDTSDSSARVREEFPAWPMGLGVYVLAGAGATAVAIRRVRTPIRRLPSGTRVA
ncbi:ABC transporter permease [Janibacter indicus]|uniref:ABC-type transport system involved in multi-copper enzyme maturation, permease component n=1 Tax=Janibacter indicus TaxID=857417 RepID=A0A1W2D842_9MICO|nr:hypothetical protein [Janibacter indicus]SMC93326.1 hypothetical protein SAMN06296429_11520 [Janibacter indicus]